ncbi:hypothetical protein AAC387_Pa03g4591 [Persea americana]
MDPNPKNFPILSYVMSQIGRKPSSNTEIEIDIEQQNHHHHQQEQREQPEGDLVKQMPHLAHPSIISSMAHAVSDVAQTRSILQTLGPRPNHEAVDSARAKISEIESRLSKQLEEIVLAPRPENVDRLHWRSHLAEREKQCREEAERERSAYKALLQLDEMHDSYEKLLREAEERLVKIYSSAEGEVSEFAPAKEETNEEVVGILQEAAMRAMERVELAGRKLRFLPEAFGRLQGLVVLNLANNELEIIPDSIAGLEKLEELCISSNLLVSLPDSIGLLLNLKILDVSGNKLKALPDSISHCRSLVELDASFNELTYLPTNIGHELVNLQKLLVHLNKIRSLPTSICEMSNFSDLTELPDTIGDLINLRELDLSNNQIHALPDTFGRLDKLTKLNLDQNPFVIPPMDVVNKGVEAVKEYMAKRWLDILVAEEERSMLEANEQSQTGWLTRSTAWLNNWVSTVSESVSGYMGTGAKAHRDPFLDQQL